MSTSPVISWRSEASQNPLEGGRQVFGRFQLESVAGRGGMGVVWKAHDSRLDRPVALKFLPDVCFLDASAHDDLKRETRRCLDLTHPHIVRIHDFVEDEEMAAIVMEYVDGDSLAQMRVDRPSRHFEPRDLEVWTAALCSALTYAHESGCCVHRDLKPSNLMVNARGALKVTDFGISCSLQNTAARVSAFSSTGGTLGYMSPQQLLGELAAPSDDVYSIGATLYELLTGRPPFYSGDISTQVREIVPDTITERRRKLGLPCAHPLPAAWEETIAACLAKHPRDRPASAAEIAHRLGLACSPIAEAAAPMGDALPPTMVGTSMRPAAPAKPPITVDWLQLKAWALAKERRPILAGACIVSLGAISLLSWRGGHQAAMNAPRTSPPATAVAPPAPAPALPPVVPSAASTAPAADIAQTPPAPVAPAPASPPSPPPLTEDQRALLAPSPVNSAPATTAAPCQVTLETTPRGIPFQVLASAYETTATEVLQSGETPAVVPLPAGAYRVIYTPAAQSSRSVVVNVPSAEKTTFLQEFPHGSVKIRTQPDGAEITCDGRVIGVGPLEVELLPGSHEITAEWKGRVSRVRRVDLADAGQQTVTIDFRSGTSAASKSRRSKPKEDDSMLTKIGRSIKTIFTGEKPKKH
ncbi:MAG TPA: serine/threonine-protein kinase [Chthoniobacter sp.]|nr:serine/threonine-protein kinase [Chthoniobacter sp.]